MLSYLFLCRYTSCEQHLSLCAYTHLYIYTLVGLHLMCPDGLDLNLFTHTQAVSFSIRLRCLVVTREIEMNNRNKKVSLMRTELFLFMQSSSLSSSLHLSFLVMIHVWLNSPQCVNLIHRFLSFFLVFDLVLSTPILSIVLR